ncbi:chemotaxis protein CheA [Clostridium sp. CX1]|uniref:chemotaxis protein CheA n=1 Tax=Clostridium sp. CX1 TaxID=2978346 RepID=UPI0021BF9FAF|nr:chemotaxis protein CheA [Clostridium sp. CX1]MCT8977421.1 chemotaxis protein CheA [Clostridium sp. CX1]
MSGVFERSEIIRAFVDEVEEQLQLLEQGILELEQSGESPELIQKIFRVAHTLKGSSSSMGFEKMKILTHEMENVLDKIRNGILFLNKTVIDILFKCLDNLKLLIDEFVVDKTNITTEINEIISELNLILEQNVSSGEVDLESLSKELFQDEDVKMQVVQAREMGLNTLLCEIHISEESFMKLTRACLIMNHFNELGTVVKTIPDLMNLSDESSVGKVSYLLISNYDKIELQKNAEEQLMDVDKVEIHNFNEVQCNQIENCKDEETVEEKSAATDKDKPNSDKKVLQTLRVDVERLEKIMNLIGELVIEQTRMAKVGSDLYNRYSQDNSVEELLGISNHITRVVSELQEGVMKTRMVPVKQLFNRLPRIVRDLSAALEKEVTLILEGEDTEMDKTIIEEISDPLIHLIRNSVDHGIEKSELRKSAGKAEKGTLKVTACHQENHVIITVEDDGAGINLEKIKESAIEKKLIAPQEAETMSREDIINLIFKSGFSTSKTVSDVSGRGVGMDIVRNHIDKLNGIIETETEEGQGTKFKIKLPLTLAILRGLLIKLRDVIYALPMSNVIEIVRKEKSEIENVKGQPIVMVRGKIIPLVWLHDYFNISRTTERKNVFVVIIGVAEKQIGIVVDELIGNQEIVVKSFGGYIGKVDGFSGATILGDGSVACILDVVGIAKMVASRRNL